MFFTFHSLYKTHIIMAAKLTHHGGQIIYVIYIYIGVTVIIDENKIGKYWCFDKERWKKFFF